MNLRTWLAHLKEFYGASSGLNGKICVLKS